MARLICFFAAILLSINASGAKELAPSTKMVQISTTEDGKLIEKCPGNVNALASYVTLEVPLFRVAKHSGWVNRLFNNQRTAFATAALTGNINGQPFKVSKMGTPRVLTKSRSQLDLGESWLLMEQTLWALDSARLELKIGYQADSTVSEIVNAFNSVTATIPDYSVSASIAIASDVARAIDQFVFGAERTTALLRSSTDLPIFGGKLCTGAYAVLAAPDASDYRKYLGGDLTWNKADKMLMHGGDEVVDISYAILEVSTKKRYYDPVDTALNDNGQLWPSKFRQAKQAISSLSFVPTKEEIDKSVDVAKTHMNDGETLLSADLRLIETERDEILSYVRNDLKKRIDIVRGTRITDGSVTPESTRNAIESVAAANSTKGISVQLPFIEFLSREPSGIVELSGDEDGRELANRLEGALDRLSIMTNTY